MFFRWNVVICAIVLLSILDVKPVIGKRGYGGSHSYPKSGGLSGGGRHGYPSSGGLSGGSHGYPSSGSHGYPSSGGLSGGSHGYPSSGGTHGYPSSGGSHGYPSSGGSHGYPSSGGSHGYPSSGGGLSGNSRPSSNKYPSGATHTTNVYNYNYNPPQQIRYTPVSGGAPVSYPVYHGRPPTYVYNIKDSGSKYGTLLTGLALLNLGTLAGTAYAISHSGNGGSGHYKPQPGEICKFGLKKDNGDYEETKIDCQLITSFILQEEGKAQNNATNTSITTTTVTNVTTVNITNGVPEPAPTTQAPAPVGIAYIMMPDGTLVPVNKTAANNTTTANATAPETNPNNNMTSSVTVTTTTTNTTVTNALDVKGKPIDVTPGMQCFVMRTTPTSRMKKSVPCGLLQTYAEKSIKKNGAGRNGPVFTILAAVITLCLTY